MHWNFWNFLHPSVCLDFFSWNAPNLLKDWRQTNRIEKAKIEKKNVLRIIPTCQLCCDCSMVLWELFVLLLFPLSLARPTSSCQEGASFCLNGIKETGRFVFFQSCLGLDQTRSSVFFHEALSVLCSDEVSYVWGLDAPNLVFAFGLLRNIISHIMNFGG